MTEPRLRLRLHFGPGSMFGPGRADLLEAIAAHGSISAAGRQMGMSYRRAWTLVEALNAGFSAPLVDSSRGGAAGGGAKLTAEGLAVLAHYRKLEMTLAEAGAAEIAALQQLACAIPTRK
ncbi:winged helix-turn-helix domain-containing protein [Pseudorhodobacter sp.]|uniref:winged helix-turn-helix domain-containing protein n=1 Tax=Pseudorhodobacter sp. TaxID=1934400 RepID=UPI002AFE1098|nr:LysR family transcriptional regulator [Pseudorhodobacter sp.]